MNLLREKAEELFKILCIAETYELLADSHRLTRNVPSLLTENILRKEVIQPQVPLRLPCYDFTPVTNPTFAGGLSCELA